MKSLRLTIAALATAAIAATAPIAFAQMEMDPQMDPMPAAEETLPSDTPVIDTPIPTQANSALFGMNETSQAPFIMVAQPTSRLGSRQRYGLMIIEQKREEPLCYSTTGSSPTQVNILLLNFDFSGICGKSTDTNGYILRTAGQDIAFDPVIENEDGVLVLYAKPRRSAPEGSEKFIIGQTDGIAANGFTQIFLKDGWRLARQTYNDSVTGRTYIANDMTVAALSGQTVVVNPGGGDQSGGGVVNPPASGTPAFPDVANDIYLSEINRAVQLGFIAGKTSTSFAPLESLTREQIVSIVVEGLGVAPADGTTVTSQFNDVPSTRWSAAKIQKAQELNIVTGDGNGVFRPTDNVTRAELIAIMRRAAEYKNNTTTLVANQTGETFTDTNGHWAESVISDLSEFCGVATPLNETGSAFYPNQPAKRNYAAAAMVRLLDCSQTTTTEQ